MILVKVLNQSIVQMYVHFLQHFDFQRHEIWQQLLFCQFNNLLNFSWCFSKCCLIQSCYLDFVHLPLIKNIAINFTLEFLFVMNYKIMIYNVAYSRSRWSIWALCIFLCLEWWILFFWKMLIQFLYHIPDSTSNSAIFSFMFYNWNKQNPNDNL